jgi:hypothetical protein
MHLETEAVDVIVDMLLDGALTSTVLGGLEEDGKTHFSRDGLQGLA